MVFATSFSKDQMSSLVDNYAENFLSQRATGVCLADLIPTSSSPPATLVPAAGQQTGGAGGMPSFRAGMSLFRARSSGGPTASSSPPAAPMSMQHPVPAFFNRFAAAPLTPGKGKSAAGPSTTTPSPKQPPSVVEGNGKKDGRPKSDRVEKSQEHNPLETLPLW
jgi:hypothetical protein